MCIRHCSWTNKDICLFYCANSSTLLRQENRMYPEYFKKGVCSVGDFQGCCRFIIYKYANRGSRVKQCWDTRSSCTNQYMKLFVFWFSVFIYLCSQWIRDSYNYYDALRRSEQASRAGVSHVSGYIFSSIDPSLVQVSYGILWLIVINAVTRYKSRIH